MDPSTGCLYKHCYLDIQYRVHILPVWLKFYWFKKMRIFHFLTFLAHQSFHVIHKDLKELTFGTLSVRVTLKTWWTFTGRFVVSSWTNGRLTAWFIICARIYTTSISTCLISSTFEIRWAANGLRFNYLKIWNIIRKPYHYLHIKLIMLFFILMCII